jgi:signal transduction histidine kinase
MSGNKITVFSLFLFFFLCFDNELIAQESNSNYFIKWFDDSSGLPQNSIKSITKDKYGYIWLLTEKGIVRYDGLNFKTFDSKSFPAINNNRMRYFIGDVESDSIIVENEDTEVFIIKERKLEARSIDVFNLENIKKHPYKFLEYSTLPSLRYRDLFYGFKAEINLETYAIVRLDTVYFYNRKNEALKEIPYTNKGVNYYFALNEKLFVINEKNECFTFNNKVEKVETDLAANEKINLFWNSISNQIFVYTNKNLSLLAFENNKIIRKPIVQNLEIDLSIISNFFYDKENDLTYLATNTKGLGIIKQKAFRTLKVEDNKFRNVFYAITNYDDENIITSSGYIINQDSVNYKKSFDFESDEYIILIDKNKDVWVKNLFVVKKYSKSSNYKDFSEWYLNTFVTTVSLDKDSNLVFSTDVNRHQKDFKVGIYRIDLEEKNIEPKLHDEVDIHILQMVHYQGDKFLIGAKEGLYLYNIETKELQAYEELKNKTIRNIQITPEGIWVFSYGYGFFMLKDNKITEIPCDKNDYLRTAHCILEDSLGFYWISSNKGIFQCSKSALMKYVENNDNVLYYHYYNKNDGFSTNEFNGGGTPSGVILNNGYFSFPSLDGLVFFNPYKINSDLKINEIYIDQIIIDDSTIYTNNNEITVDFEFDRITIFANSPYYFNNSNLDIEVEITGPTNQKWDNYNQLNGISFTGLKSGEYILRFRQLNGFDSEYNYATFKIIIPKKLHETIAFRTSSFLLILVFIYALISIRLDIVRKRNIMLVKKIDERTMHLKETIKILNDNQNNLVQQLNFQEKLTHLISHDVKSPLKYIENIIDKIKNNIKNENFPVLEGLEAVQSSSKSLYIYIEQLLEESKKNHQKEGFEVENIPIYDFVNEKIKIYSSILALNNISIKNLIPLSAEIKSNPHLLSIIIHNLLDNAIKNTKQGEIIIGFEEEEFENILIIKDTGIGMSKEMLEYLNNSAKNISYTTDKPTENKKGIGLDIVISLIHYLNLKMTMKSEIAKGTEVVLKFKK